MQYYNDKSNEKAINTIFLIFQIFMMMIVYSFVYMSFVAVALAIKKFDLTFMTYLPEVLTLFAYPLVMIKTRKMFKKGKKLTALGWLVGWASVLIVFLYAHLSQLIPA